MPIFDAIRRTPRTAMRDENEITDTIQIMVDDGLPVYTADVVRWDVNLTAPADVLTCNLLELRRRDLDRLMGRIPASIRVRASPTSWSATVRGSSTRSRSATA